MDTVLVNKGINNLYTFFTSKMATKIKTRTLTRRVFVNKRTGQASITLPKKFLMKWLKRMPKKLTVNFER